MNESCFVSDVLSLLMLGSFRRDGSPLTKSNEPCNCSIPVVDLRSRIDMPAVLRRVRSAADRDSGREIFDGFSEAFESRRNTVVRKNSFAPKIGTAGYHIGSSELSRPIHETRGLEKRRQCLQPKSVRAASEHTSSHSTADRRNVSRLTIAQAANFSRRYSWCKPPRTGFETIRASLGMAWRGASGGAG